MADRFIVYCKKSVSALTPEELLAGVQLADLHTIAEDYDLSDEEITDALNQLRVANITLGAFQRFRLSYRTEGERQIEVERWPIREIVEGVKEEVLQDMEGEALFEKVNAHFKETVDIVWASFGSSAEEAMAPVIASEAMRWIAEKYDGIVRHGSVWWRLGARYHEYQLLTP